MTPSRTKQFLTFRLPPLHMCAASLSSSDTLPLSVYGRRRIGIGFCDDDDDKHTLCTRSHPPCSVAPTSVATMGAAPPPPSRFDQACAGAQQGPLHKAKAVGLGGLRGGRCRLQRVAVEELPHGGRLWGGLVRGDPRQVCPHRGPAAGPGWSNVGGKLGLKIDFLKSILFRSFFCSFICTYCVFWFPV